MKILIVEDDKAAVEAIKDAMSYTEDMQVVGTLSIQRTHSIIIPMPWSVSCNQWAIIWKLRLPKKICVGSHAPN